MSEKTVDQQGVNKMNRIIESKSITRIEGHGGCSVYQATTDWCPIERPQDSFAEI